MKWRFCYQQMLTPKKKERVLNNNNNVYLKVGRLESIIYNAFETKERASSHHSKKKKKKTMQQQYKITTKSFTFFGFPNSKYHFSLLLFLDDFDVFFLDESTNGPDHV